MGRSALCMGSNIYPSHRAVCQDTLGGQHCDQGGSSGSQLYVAMLTWPLSDMMLEGDSIPPHHPDHHAPDIATRISYAGWKVVGVGPLWRSLPLTMGPKLADLYRSKV